MSGAKITPATGDVREFLGKHGSSISRETIEPLDWSAIPSDRLPICLIETDQKQTGWILINREEFRKYKYNKIPTAAYNYFSINIEKLWDNSNLKDFVGLIEDDRIHSGKIEGLNKEALLDDIAKKLYREKSEEAIAEQYKIPIKMIKQLVLKLRIGGVRIPSKTKARFDVRSYISKLARTTPELVDVAKIRSLASRTTNGSMNGKSKRGRPPGARV